MSEARPLLAAYTTERASALAGVPSRTLYYWVKTALVTPGVSAGRVQRWSFADVLTLRLIQWLRTEKLQPKSTPIPRTSMRQIRRLLGSIDTVGDRLQEGSLRVMVQFENGLPVLEVAGLRSVALGRGYLQLAQAHGTLDLLREFKPRTGLWGPDLQRPGPHLRIVPGKLSGEPHAEGTRVTTLAMSSLIMSGLDVSDVLELYPMVSPEQVAAAVELEKNLAQAAA